MDKVDRRTRGARAKAWLNDDLIKEAFKTLEAEYLRVLVASDLDTTAARRAQAAIHVLGDVRRQLSSVISDGTLAQAELDRLAGTARL